MKCLVIHWFFAVLAIAATADVVAQPRRIDCENPATNIEIGACLDRELKAADAELNRVYKAAMAAIERSDHLTPELRGEWKAALRAAQRLWISYRDADCRTPIEYEWWGGSGVGMAILSCLLEKTKVRVSELRERYDSR